MAKYAEGAVSSSGKYIVRGGKWVPRDEARVGEAREPGREIHSPASILGASMMGKAYTPESRAEFERGVSAGAMVVPLTALAAGGGLGGAVGGALRFAATPAGGAALGGLEGARRGPVEAAKGAALGAAGIGALGRGGALLQFLSRFRGGGKAAKLAVRMAGKAPGAAAEATQAAGAALTPAGAAGALPGAAQAALALPKTLSQEQLIMVGQLRGMAQGAGANKASIQEAVKEAFGTDWKSVWKFIMTPRGSMATNLGGQAAKNVYRPMVR